MTDAPAHLAAVLAHLSGVEASGDGWLARCPNPAHSTGRGDRRPSLRVALGEAGRVLLVCRTGCATDAVLAAAGLDWKALLPPPGEADLYLARAARKAAREIPPADRAARDRAYRYVLERLTLEPEHEAHLVARGFPPEALGLGGYRTIRTHTFLAALRGGRADFDPAAYAGPVPGLREAGRNPLYSGLAVPVRDPDGRVVALKVRRFAGDPRYCYLSDPEAPSGTPGHWPVFRGRDDSSTLRVTEGELKADLATLKSGVYTVGVPGVAAWRPLVADLAARFGPAAAGLTFTLAFDWPDVRDKPGVRDQCRALLAALAGLGGRVAIEHWAQDFKGIDDLLAAGHAPDVAAGAEACRALLDGLDAPRPTLAAECVGVYEAGGVAPVDAFDGGPGPADACEFPAAVFPPGVREFVQNVTARTDSPLDFAAVGSLLVAATAIGATRRVRVLAGWLEAPCFYAGIVAPPGSGKSPVLNRVQRPMVLKQREAIARHRREMDAWAAAGDKTRPRPTLTDYYSSDVTVAALTDRLGKNPRGLLLAPDEIMSWVRGFGQVGLGNDQDVYLTIWSGHPLKVDRKTGDMPVTWIDHPYVSVLGGIQPARLKDLSDGGRSLDGFMDRFLLTYPAVTDPPEWKPADYLGGGADDDLAELWNGVIYRLYGLAFDRGYPGVLELGPAGWEYACDWYNGGVRKELCDPAFPEYLRGPWLKLRAHFFRFALALELLWWAAGTPGDPPTTISRRSLVLASALVRYFCCQARRVAGHATPSEEVRAVDELARWALGGRKGGVVSARDVVRSNNPLLPRRMADARALLVTAAQYGAGTYHPALDGKKDVLVVARGPAP